MRHFMLVSLCLAAVACSGQAAMPTSPSSAILPGPLQATAQSQPVDVAFTKWFPVPGSPQMVGITDEGGDPGTYAGVLLRRTPLNDQIAELEARYQVINASGHSFIALIEGKSHIPTGHATLNGVVTEGWSVGAQVHVTFDAVPCAQAPNGVCFQGTIRVMPGSAN
jgi:hypothetical protein